MNEKLRMAVWSRAQLLTGPHYQGCRAHVINLGVEACFKLIHKEATAARGLLNSMRASVKRSDMFETAKVELRLSDAILPCLDVETRWSSPFKML